MISKRVRVAPVTCWITAFAFMLLVASSVQAQSATTSQQWQTRAQATADNSKQARALVLDAIYAQQGVVVARAYQKAWKQQPNNVTRFVNFAWAAMCTEEYANQQHDPSVYKMVDHAVTLMKPYFSETAKQDNRMHSLPAQPPMTAFSKQLVNNSMAWMVWGHYLARYIFNETPEKLDAEAAYKHALSLDPTLAEAYYWLAKLPFSPLDMPYFKMRQSTLFPLLDRAEHLQPKLHILAVAVRAGFTSTSGNYKDSANYYTQYLRLWPNAPHADRVRIAIKALEQAAQKP